MHDKKFKNPPVPRFDAEGFSQGRLHDTGGIFYFPMPKINNPQDPNKALIAQIFLEQVNFFHEKYDTEKYNQADEKGRNAFITELKSDIKKYEIAENLKTEEVSLNNQILDFTDEEKFQHKVQLETAKMILPFFRAQLEFINESLSESNGTKKEEQTKPSNEDEFVKRFIRALKREYVEEYWQLLNGSYVGTDKPGYIMRLLHLTPKRIIELLDEEEYPDERFERHANEVWFPALKAAIEKEDDEKAKAIIGANTALKNLDWIGMLKKQGWFLNDFAPFRVFEHFSKDSNGDYFGHWCTWVVNNDKLQKVTPVDGELVTDWIVLGQADDDAGIVGRLNSREETEYKKRVSSLPLSSLRHQRRLWEELDFKEPLKTSNLGLKLDYKPIEILNREIQERMLDKDESNKSKDVMIRERDMIHKLKKPKKKKTSHRRVEKRVNSKSKEKRIEWSGNRSEFCRFVKEEYEKNKAKYKSLRSAALIFYKLYRFPYRWSANKCTQLIKRV